jgi:HRAS-like suppressor 3
MTETLTPGTQLTTRRVGFRHHGLYAGDGKVLHYGGLHRYGWRRPVEEVSLAQFARGRGFEVVTGGAARFAGAAAVERARSRLGEDRYRLLSNNCEHFVTWALDGTPRSMQVEVWRERVQRARAALAWMTWPLQLQPRAAAAQRR